MKKTWPLILLISLSLMALLPAGVDGASAGMSIEDDEFYISVDPSDDNRGYLEIEGTIEADITNILDRVTVQLDVVVFEHRDGEPTGMKWAAGVSFDGGAAGADVTILTRSDDSADFTVYISSEYFDPQDEDTIIVPEGIGPNVTGKVEITASYSGDASGSDIETATVIPDYYHLVEVSTNSAPLEVRANHFINYTFRIINSGNDVESITLELPTMDELIANGWTGEINKTSEDYMSPGSEFKARMLLQAPKKIERDETIDFRVRVYSEYFDPITEEPASEDEIIIEFNLIKSEVIEPVPDDDDDDDDDNDDDISGEYDPANDSPVVLIIVITLVVLIVALVLIVFFIKGGGGDEEGGDEGDMHSSMVRI